MTKPRPSLPGNLSWNTEIPLPNFSRIPNPKLPLGRLPIIGGWFRKMESLTLASNYVRREARGVLWQELARLLRERMTLTESLEAMALEEQDGLGFVGGLLFLWWIGYLFPASSNEARFVRILAAKLGQEVARGLPLSAAMRNHSGYFERGEILIVEAAEAANDLPGGVQRLADFTAAESDAAGMANYLAYPLIVIGFAVLAYFFFFNMVAPEFFDIFNALGVQVPEVTAWLFAEGGDHFSTVLPGFLSMAFLLHLLLGRYLNGTALEPLRLILMLLYLRVLLVPLLMVFILVMQMVGTFIPPFAQNPITGALLIEAITVAVLLPWFLALVERVHVTIDRRTLWLFGWLMGWSGAVRQGHTGRWLAALDLALATRRPLPDCLRFCAGAVPGTLSRRSKEAANLAEKGIDLGALVERQRLLPPYLARQVAYLAERNQLEGNIAPLASDAMARARLQTVRASRVIATGANIAAGALVAFICLSIYLTLYAIPTAIAKNDDNHPQRSAAHVRSY